LELLQLTAAAPRRTWSRFSFVLIYKVNFSRGDLMCWAPSWPWPSSEPCSPRRSSANQSSEDGKVGFRRAAGAGDT